MNWLGNLRGRVRAFFRKERLDGEMSEELRPHIEMQAQENMLERSTSQTLTSTQTV